MLTKKSYVKKALAGVVLSLALLSTFALAVDEYYMDPARIDYARPDATKRLELIDCFTNGNCKNDDKIRIYPMPCEGSGGADCTGCYAMRGGSPIRIGDLNLSTGNCAGVGNADEQKLRVFVGYERKCPGGAATCSDGQLLLSCTISSEGGSGVANSVLGYNRDCFAGRPYVRRAQATLATVAVTVQPSIAATDLPQCPAGMTGVYPSCIPCSSTSYKSVAGPGACTACASPVIMNSASVTYSTAGTTKTSSNDCRVIDFSCASPYTKNVTTGSCEDSSACLMSFDISHTESSTTANSSDGSISGFASTPSSGPVEFSVNPNLGQVTSGAGSSSSGSGGVNLFWGAINGLPPGGYSVTATDKANPSCFITRSATVMTAPSPTPTPDSEETCHLSLITTSVTQPSSLTAKDGAFTIEPTGELDVVTYWIFNHVTGKAAEANVTYSGRSVIVTGLGIGHYLVTATDRGAADCTARKYFGMIGPQPSPTPSPSFTPRICPPGMQQGYNELPPVTNASTGPGGIRTLTFNLDYGFQPGDPIIHMAWHVYASAYTQSPETPITVAAQIANFINTRPIDYWDSGWHARPPQPLTPGFPPTASSAGSVLTVIMDDLSKYNVRAVIPFCVDSP